MPSCRRHGWRNQLVSGGPRIATPPRQRAVGTASIIEPFFASIDVGPMQRTPPAPGRRSNGPRAVIEYGPIAALAKKAGRLDALDRALRQTLPMPLREQVRFANLHAGRLIFLAPTSAWAARLRLMQTNILDSARAIGVNAYAVVVKVAPLPQPPVEPDRSKPLSAGAARHLKAAAASVADPELKQLFLQLAAAAAAKSGGV
jgi:hypothetical protein